MARARKEWPALSEEDHRTPDPERPAGRGRWPRGGIAAGVAAILRRSGGPLSIAQLGPALVAEGWPLGDGWQNRLRGALRDHDQVCRTGTSTYDLFARRVIGARLLHTLTTAEVQLGVLLAEPDLGALLMWWRTDLEGRAGEVDWSDAAGTPHQAALTVVPGPEPQAHGLPSGDRTHRILVGLEGWLREQGARPGDEVCISPQPPDARRFRLTLERSPGTTTADDLLAERALSILLQAKTVLRPRSLLQRLVGQMDLRGGLPVHLPVFVLGRDPRMMVAETHYVARALVSTTATRSLPTPHPRPEDYPQDWPERDIADELLQHFRRTLPSGVMGDAMLQAELERMSSEARAQFAAARRAIWQLLLDRSRLLNPPAAPPVHRPGGRVIRGPWPGS